jgi:hypothetical protein
MMNSLCIRILLCSAREMARLFHRAAFAFRPPISDRCRLTSEFQRVSICAFLLYFFVSLFETAFAQNNVTPITPPSNLHIVTSGTVAATVDIPILNWQQRSDWINVKTNVPAAIGDGVADDTAALQAALNSTNVGKTVYLPAGAYKITQTLTMTGPAAGSAIIGNGRATRIVWGGAAGGVMFTSDGIAYSRYIGLTWDGSNTAAVGFDHASTNGLETEVQHIDEAFRNFTNSGIRIGNNQVVASSEILYYNCLFTNCGTGLAFLAFNDYDNTIDHCEFDNCGTGIVTSHGNFYARNSHFQNSSQADMVVQSEHGDSVRRCTSVGSKYFVQETGTIATLTLQDCQVANWTAPDGAVYLYAYSAMIFDCVFTNGASNSFPLTTTFTPQEILLSDNSPAPIAALLSNPDSAPVYIIPNGVESGTLTSASQRFLQGTETVPSTTFDVMRNFGAKGDGQTDDTTAIQSAINAARLYGSGAIAYLPTGNYVISQTLLVTGSNYTVGGSGFLCNLIWDGPNGAPYIMVSNVQNVAVANLSVADSSINMTEPGDDIFVTGSNQPSQLLLDGIYAYGAYSYDPDSHGIHFEALPAGSVVTGSTVQGNLWITNCAQDTFLFRTSYEGTVTVQGPSVATNVFAGFLTRLATQVNPALQIYDNQPLVMSDFFTEQGDQIATFEGTSGQNAGAITLQSPKVTMNTTNPIYTVYGYTGRISYTSSEFYQGPATMVFQTTSAPSLQLVFAGGLWYGATPSFSLSSGTPMLIASRGVSDSGLSAAGTNALAASLDDLRSLGQLDNSLPQINP